MFLVEHPSLERNLFGLKFRNPVGLAAGFDKDAKYIEVMEALGFGFVEIGTVTPMPQPGNDKPRLFRLVQDKAVINRMGFNNQGADVIAARLRDLKERKILIGGNIGKNKVTPNEEAVNDYMICFEKLFDHVDYFVVNVSSPNTPGLRALQNKDSLLEILKPLQEANQKKSHSKPILLKIAPDLDKEQVFELVELVQETGIAGIIATNTTISRDHLKTPSSTIDAIGMGGLSGKPVEEKSNLVIDWINEASRHSIPVIGVGGIMDTASAQRKTDKHCELIQLYTGFIYGGPLLTRDINRSLIKI